VRYKEEATQDSRLATLAEGICGLYRSAHAAKGRGFNLLRNPSAEKVATLEYDKTLGEEGLFEMGSSNAYQLGVQ